MDDRSALASPTYARAFTQVMSGVDPALLADAERRALRDAREAAGFVGSGYPMPAPVTEDSDG